MRPLTEDVRAGLCRRQRVCAAALTQDHELLPLNATHMAAGDQDGV